MFRGILILFTVLLLLATQPILAVMSQPVHATAEQRARVTAWLAQLHTPPAHTDATIDDDAFVEDVFVKGGDAILPAIQEILADKRAEYDRMRTDSQRTTAFFRLEEEINVLDHAMVRLRWNWNVNPPQLITQWMSKLTFSDGRPFKFGDEVIPVRVADDRLLTIFPDRLFYVVYRLGYPGGAAPPEEVLRAFETPPPMTDVNLFVVKKDGTIQLIAGKDALKQYFQDTLPPITTAAKAKDAMYAWLRLNEPYWLWARSPIAFTIPEASLTVAGRQASGKAVVIPENNNSGELDGEMTFDARGKLINASLIANLRLSIAPLPCSAPPPMGPAGGMQPAN